MFDVDFERFIVEGVGGETTLVEVRLARPCCFREPEESIPYAGG